MSAGLCAAPGCDNPVARRVGRAGRTPIYCSPACRPSRRRGQPGLTVDVELDHSDDEPDRAGLDWMVCLRRGPESVVVRQGLGRFSATAFANELRGFLGQPRQGGVPIE